MKVYVVHSYYEIAGDRYLERIFSTLEKAQKYSDENTDDDMQYHIMECDVDEE